MYKLVYCDFKRKIFRSDWTIADNSSSGVVDSHTTSGDKSKSTGLYFIFAK